MFRANLGAALLMVLYGVAAAVPLPGFAEFEDLPVELGFWQRLVTLGLRFQGALGNAAYVASYLMFSIFYSLYLWAWEAKPMAFRKISGYATLALLFLVFIGLSGTRAALVGLLAATVGFGLFMILRSGRIGRTAAVLFGALAVLSSLLFVLRHELVAKIPSIRILAVSWGEASVQCRLKVWEAAWKGFLDRPLFGWGPENFLTVFDKYFDTRYCMEGQQTWWDRAHNIVFDCLAENGVITFLAYCSIPVSFYGALFRKMRRDRRESGPTTLRRGLQQGLLFAMTIGYLTQGLFMFDTLPIYISYSSVLAFAIYEFGLGSNQ